MFSIETGAKPNWKEVLTRFFEYNKALDDFGKGMNRLRFGR